MIYGIHKKEEEVHGIVKPDSQGKHNKTIIMSRKKKKKKELDISTPFLLLIHIAVGQKPTKSNWRQVWT